MKHKNFQTGTGLRSIIISVVFSFLANNGFTQPVSTGSMYLGQTPPGNTPKVFPLSVNQGFFAAERIAISNDGTKPDYSDVSVYWVRIDGFIDSLKQANKIRLNEK